VIRSRSSVKARARLLRCIAFGAAYGRHDKGGQYQLHADEEVEKQPLRAIRDGLLLPTVRVLPGRLVVV
jgi:hypothetical protein